MIHHPKVSSFLAVGYTSWGRGRESGGGTDSTFHDSSSSSPGCHQQVGHTPKSGCSEARLSSRVQLPRAHPALLCGSLTLSEASASHLTHFRTQQRPLWSSLFPGRRSRVCNCITRPAPMASSRVFRVLLVPRVTPEGLSGGKKFAFLHGTSLKGPRSIP